VSRETGLPMFLRSDAKSGRKRAVSMYLDDEYRLKEKKRVCQIYRYSEV